METMEEEKESNQLEEPWCLSWTCEEVADWIASIGFPQYKECFTTNVINGRRLIWVTSSTLPNLGITDWKHIQEITSKVHKLLHIQPTAWNRSITLPHRCEMGIFLERKSQTGQYGNQLRFRT